MVVSVQVCSHFRAVRIEGKEHFVGDNCTLKIKQKSTVAIVKEFGMEMPKSLILWFAFWLPMFKIQEFGKFNQTQFCLSIGL